MRLHSLELTAFGSFRDTQRVDFEALSGAGLFLVVGATGAGKSTVLDAVTFALYGDVAGDRGRRGLRSDHAPAGVAPRVVLEVTVRGRRLRMTRSPEWSRPKKRGEGTVSEHASVLLEQCDVDGSWTALTTRLDEAGHLVTELLGMSREQFCQVALLPQNAFARFLQAGSDERRDVLERLFSARVYTDTEAWLAEHRTELGRARDQARQAVAAVADRIAEVAGTDGAPQPEDAEPDALPGWAAGLRAAAEARLAEVTTATARADAGLAERQAALDDATRLAERQRRHADYQRRAAELDQAAGVRAGLAAELDAARRAARVVPLLGAVSRHAAARAEADGALGTALAAAVAAGLLPAGSAPSDLDIDALAGAERDRRDEASRLDALRADADRLADLATGIDQLDTELDKLRIEAASTDAELAGFPAAEQLVTAELLAARTRAAGLPAARDALAAAAELCEAVTERDALAATLATAEEALRAATVAAQDLREVWLSVKEARLSGMAAELAGLLTGAACPVCGSTDHPDPAVAEADAPSRQDELAAQHGYEAARAEAEAARAEVSGLRGRLDALARSVGEADLAGAREALAARTAELDEAQEADADVPRLDARHAELSGRWQQFRERATELAAELAATEAHRRDRDAEAGTIRVRLDRARGADASVTDRIARLSAEAGDLARLAGHAVAAQAARTELDAAVRAASAEAVESGFGDPDGDPEGDLDRVRSAARDADAVAALEAGLRRYDDEQATVRSGLEEEDLRAAAAAGPPDLDALRATLDEARAGRDAAVEERSGLAHRVDRIGALRAELDAAVDAWRPAARRYLVAHRMAQLAQGTAADNALRMRLSAYVLAARMEQVVAEANHRLDDMSGGRYLLSHSVDRRTGERRGGLGLRVTDNWTGRERDPASLSGGEKFYVSLSLALGLMAVVTAEAGGVELDTLFVDEGFGALDEDTLDDVMAVLDSLRDGGRAVGIVSHVADLRTRIPTQLRVTKTPTGSTVAHHTG